MRRKVMAFAILGLAASLAPAADDWPEFRGPGGQGHSDAVGLPLKWSETENVAWKVPVEGRAWSSPVVIGDQVWVTTAQPTKASAEEARKKLDSLGYAVPSPEVARHVTLGAVCLDRRTGRVVRRLTLWEDHDPPVICSVNSYASPTPAAEAGRLYCDFGSMGTACVDTETGNVLWTRRLAVDHQVGPGSSPILDGELLVLVRDGCDQQYVTALDKNSGRTVWKTDRPPIETAYTPYKKAFSTPLVIGTAGSRQMVVPGAKWIVSYEPQSGRPLWRVDTGASFSNASRPVFAHGMVYVCTAFGGSYLWAVRCDGAGDVSQTHVAWKSQKQVPKRSSPLVAGEEIYMISDRGVVTCLDARSGEVHWGQRVLGDCSASPLLAGGRLYFFDEEGKTAVLRAGKEFALLAENKLQGRIMASPAVAGRAMFVRTETHLYRIEGN